MLVKRSNMSEVLQDEILLYLIFILIILSCFVISGYCYHYYKKRITFLIKEGTDLKEKLLQTQLSYNKLQLIIQRMKIDSKQISEVYKHKINHCQSVIVGMHFYIAALCNKNLSQLNSQDLHCFIECYKEIDIAFFQWIEKNKVQLTNREITVCIFIRMGKEKHDIIDLLHCSDGSYRTIKNRIKCKLSVKFSNQLLEEVVKDLH